MADKTTTLKTKTNDNVYPNVIGDNRDNAIVNSAHIKHTLTAEHKINFRLDDNVSNLIFNSLQKPAGLTKTKLVGVGTNGQENIEIGDNLTLANGKLSATGGGGGSSIPVIEGTIVFDEASSNYTVSLSKAPTGNNFILYNQNYGDNFLPAYLNMLIWNGNSTDGYDYMGCWYDTEIIGAIFTHGTSGSVFVTGAHYVAQATTADVGSILTISEDHYPEWKLPSGGSGSIPPLPADASTSTYVLKAVNGTVQWVKES